jgi:MerR family transcriptional regulator, light-induced transcriptional regulator
MAEQEGKYNIKAASLMLGIQPGTLRAWERRYQMIAPVRNEFGHRLYTEEHIRILKWLIKKVNQGFTISQAISLMENSQLQIKSESLDFKKDDQLTSLLEELFEAVVHFNEIKAQGIMNLLFSIFSIEKVLMDVFRPIQLKIEDNVESGKISRAQEYFASSLIKARIVMIIQSVPHNPNLPKAVTVSCPGEGYDIGLLILTCFLRRQGVEVIHIGANLTEEEVNKVTNIIQPEILFISCSREENQNVALELFSRVSTDYPSVSIGLVGNAMNTLNEAKKGQFSAVIVGQTPQEWEKWLLER